MAGSVVRANLLELLVERGLTRCRLFSRRVHLSKLLAVPLKVVAVKLVPARRREGAEAEKEQSHVCQALV